MGTTVLMLTRIEERIDARIPSYGDLLRLRDFLKSNRDLEFTRSQLIDKGFERALVVLERPLPRPAVHA